MGETKELNIKNESYYFYNDLNNIKNFHSNLLKIDKKFYKDVTILVISQLKSLEIVKIFIA